MEEWSRNKIINIVAADIDRINTRKEEIKKAIDEQTQDHLDFLDALLEQISLCPSETLIAKTPKVSRKRNFKQIETIPEDDMVDISQIALNAKKVKSEEQDEDVTPGMSRRSKREAAKKAGDIIKRQQSSNLITKMRRPSKDDVTSEIKKTPSSGSEVKRLKLMRSSDEYRERSRQSKDSQPASTRSTRIQVSVESVFNSTEKKTVQSNSSSVKRKRESTVSRKISRTSSLHSPERDSKKANIIDETLEAPSADDTIEPSMYEDAIGKAIPVMNSTMKLTSIANQTRVIIQTPGANETRIINPNPNQTRVISSNPNDPLERMMNVTVVLESVRKMNETRTVTKAPKTRSNSGSTSNSNTVPSSNSATDKVGEVANERNASPFSPPLMIPKIAQIKLKPLVETDPLITDDESSPERKLPREKKIQKKRSVAKIKEEASEKVISVSRSKRITRSSLMSEDEVDMTPGRKVLGEVNSERNRQVKNGSRKNIVPLFSPYSKQSVLKKVEAFEQAGRSSPVVEIDSGMRLTRTKTRALAAASDNGEQHMPNPPTIAQKLARKSLAKAKQISRAKDAKENEESKENQVNSVQKLLPNDKLVQKQQQRITPNSKIRPPMPSSISRGQTTPSNSQSLANYSKTMTGSRTNIVTNVDSFIQVKGSAQKPTSADKLMEERKRKQQEEDAKRKRDEALKAQIEEKKRKREEKERKNRLAKEAKEKQEMEKRLKLEREKEDKARKALQVQEKQREEAERKRMLLQQRAQEKEERRKQEEQLRLQRLQEQEEMERLLAEQRRREQEAERRRLAESKAQQQAAAEAMKMKAQILSAQAKKQALAQNKQQQHHQIPNSYKIDSEPDSESDDELKPKHEIPSWAKNHYRHKHLVMQEYIPLQAIMRLFDVKKCTPDLSELFKGIDKNRLKRTSSAIWKTPPRFSMMDAID